MHTVVVLGASYAGHRAVHILVNSLPEDWKVVVIERNTHFNHLYAFPRLAVLPGHEHKAFIPYTNIFKPKCCPGNAKPTGAPEPVASHQFVHGNVTMLEPNRVHFNRLSPGDNNSDPSYIDFDYLVYALGSHLPAPINIWSSNRVADYGTQNSSQESLLFVDEHAGTKQEASKWLRDAQNRIKTCSSVLVVGGGALGVQFATDIADMYPEKPVTLVHSRDQLLPRFDKWMHHAVTKRLNELSVRTLLNTRIDLSSTTRASRASTPYSTPPLSSFSSRASSPALSTPEFPASPCPTPLTCFPTIPSFTLSSPLAQPDESPSTVFTTDGTKIEADLILFCTGQVQNTSFLKTIAPLSINRTNGGAAYVLPTLQLAMRRDGGELEPSEHSHIFVVGDAADALDAPKSGSAAWYQAELAARNILRLTRMNNEELESYSPPPIGIKVTLGLRHAIHQSRKRTFEHRGPEQCDEVLNVAAMWQRRGLAIDDMTV